MTRLICVPVRALRRSILRSSAPASSNITQGPPGPTQYIGDAELNLLKELENLYWTGVEQELRSILFAIKDLQRPEFSHIELEDEKDDFIHGFDTFVDQVCEESREFANDYALTKDKKAAAYTDSYAHALRLQTQAALADKKSAQLKIAVREGMKDRSTEPILKRRVRMLLQAAGFLDIEKLVEHRPPLDKLSFWKRPAIPQLHLKKFNKAWEPIFVPLKCNSCGTVIRSSIYCCTETYKSSDASLPDKICEECYREKYLDHPGFVKRYKHCILHDIITPSISNQICRCVGVQHRDYEGKPIALFPVDKISRHINPWGKTGCVLLKLRDIVAEAKYDGMRTLGGIGKRKKKWGKKIGLMDERNRRQREAERLRRYGSAVNRKTRNKGRFQHVTKSSLHNPSERAAASETAAVHEEDEADDDIPWFLRKYAEKYPFGNVHMALRVGPIVIENGVAKYVGASQHY